MSVDVAAKSHFFTPLERNPDARPSFQLLEDLEKFCNIGSRNMALPQSDNKPSF
jgi:hypothetical protein